MNTIPITDGACLSHKHGICWASIIGGAVAAVAVSFAFFVLASSYGLAISSPWSGKGVSAEAVGANAIIAIIVIQWLSSALGGYLAGRLRTRWNIHTDEVAFRDTAHGFLTWCVATLFMVAFLGSAMSAVVGGGAMSATAIAASENANGRDTNDTNSYFIDSLFRSNGTPMTAADGTIVAPPPSDPMKHAEVARIIAKSMTEEGITDADKSYAANVIAAQTGISTSEAATRLDTTIADIKKATDTARKTAATLAIFTFLSLVIGAFIAAVAAALGGRCRDDVPLAVV